MNMPQRLGEVIKQARHARRLTRRRLADQVTKEDGTPISPQYLFDTETHHRIPSLHVLQELARVLEQDYDTFLVLAGAADTVVRGDLEAHPQHTEAVIKLFRTAQQRGFREWDHLCQRVDRGPKGGS
jgi:transcriptional regulator with XRE-family HTH domain